MDLDITIFCLKSDPINTWLINRSLGNVIITGGVTLHFKSLLGLFEPLDMKNVLVLNFYDVGHVKHTTL